MNTITINRGYNENTTIRRYKGVLTRANKSEVTFDIYAPNDFEASKDINNYIDVTFRPSRIEKIMSKIKITEMKFTIKIQSLSGDACWYWDGNNFDTLDFSPSKCGSANPFDYSYDAEEIEAELINAKKYADEKYESGEFVLSSENVFVNSL